MNLSESELAPSERGKPLSEAEDFTWDAEGDTIAGVSFTDAYWFVDAYWMVRNPKMAKKECLYRDGLIEFWPDQIVWVVIWRLMS